MRTFLSSRILACISFFSKLNNYVVVVKNYHICLSSQLQIPESAAIWFFYNFGTLDVGILGGVVMCPGTCSDQCYNHILYAHDSCIKCLRLFDRGLVGNWWEIVQVH